MHRWETRMRLKYYLDQGVTKAELSRRFGVSERTIYYWIAKGHLDRDLVVGGTRYASRRQAKHKSDPYKGIIDTRLTPFRKTRPVPRLRRDAAGGGRGPRSHGYAPKACIRRAAAPCAR